MQEWKVRCANIICHRICRCFFATFLIAKLFAVIKKRKAKNYWGYYPTNQIIGEEKGSCKNCYAFPKSVPMLIYNKKQMYKYTNIQINHEITIFNLCELSKFLHWQCILSQYEVNSEIRRLSTSRKSGNNKFDIHT